MSFQWIIEENQPKTGIPNKPSIDYMHIDSMDKLQKHFHYGDLVKILLMPKEFGGENSAHNMLYVTKAAMKEKQDFDQQILKIASGGKKLFYNINPEYKGKSYIPFNLHISIISDKTIDHTIHIW